MSTEQATEPAGFRVEISPDKLTATLVIESGAAVTLQQIMTLLRDMKVKGFDDGLIIEALEKHPPGGAMTLEIARGTGAVDERAAKVDFRVPVSEGASVSVTRVDAAQVLATMTPGTTGAAGVDVFGEPIIFKPAGGVRLGKGVSLVNGEVIANLRGSLRLCDGCLTIEPLLEYTIDNATTIEFDGDVVVKAGLRDGKIVRVKGALFVGGTVEAADVKVDGPMHVKGGLIGKLGGRCVTGGDVSCRFISGMRLNSCGDVNVSGEVVHGHVMCAGRLVVSRGPVYGGEIRANGGLTCVILGNDSGVQTIVEVGGEALRTALMADLTQETEFCRKRAGDIREKIEPLMKHLKCLTPKQREKVTIFMSEASEMESQLEEKTTLLTRRSAVIVERERVDILVTGMLHAGVTLRLGGIDVAVATDVKGPVRISIRRVGETTELVQSDESGQNTRPLPVRPAALTSRSSQPAVPSRAVRRVA